MPHCPQCGKVIAQQTVAADRRRGPCSSPEGTRFRSSRRSSAAARASTGRCFEELRGETASCACASTARCVELDEELEPRQEYKMHNIEVVVDRLVVKPRHQPAAADRLASRPRSSWRRAGRDRCRTAATTCSSPSSSPAPTAASSLRRDRAPRCSRFNSPFGACPTATGLGVTHEFDPELVVDPGQIAAVDEGAARAGAGQAHRPDWQVRSCKSQWPEPRST